MGEGWVEGYFRTNTIKIETFQRLKKSGNLGSFIYLKRDNSIMIKKDTFVITVMKIAEEVLMSRFFIERGAVLL
ncbi:MAG: hypothetical protein CV087_02880 [Candidatus Brocadia sp. WS118]|nr:MAG: hypothetical protein CV087_02880 [Candidatus Brocadia sp. WS118]